MDTDDAAPGWDAIEAALSQLYPDVVPLHYGTLIKWRLGGPDPLDGISVYPRPDHWHLVTFGMSELYAKETDDPEESGFGFEFTFRIARTAAETDPPNWALNFVQNLARYVFTSGNAFAPGHHLDLNGPISLAKPDTAIRAAAFIDDPELFAIATPFGRLRFLQVVGITLPEYAAIEQWNAERLLETLAARLPLLVTDLSRADLSTEPSVAAAVAEGARLDGSATGSLYVSTVGWHTDTSGTTVTLGASAAERIGRVLAGRLPFDRGLLILGSDARVGFRRGERLTITDQGNGFVDIELPLSVLGELTAVLRPVAGTYRLPSAPGLTVTIAKSQILDQSGAVVKEVG